MTASATVPPPAGVRDGNENLVRLTGAAGEKVANWRIDKRTKCWHQVLELATKVDASVVVIESVRAALTRGLGMVEGIEAEWAAKGFQSYRVLENATAFGVPQNRPRLLLVLMKTFVFGSAAYPLIVLLSLIGTGLALAFGKIRHGLGFSIVPLAYLAALAAMAAIWSYAEHRYP